MARKRGKRGTRRRERWTKAHVRRLFWRAGFGATEEETARWTRAGRAATLAWILDGDGPAQLRGPSPHVGGRPLDPGNEFGDEVLWWLDRMVRTTRPLEEKLTLFWHDHFATNGVETALMLRQNETLRRHSLGRFPELLEAVTLDPAMQLFLSVFYSHKNAPNENFPRELMELFTLGSGYTESDVREAARAMTGFVPVKQNGSITGTRLDPARFDDGAKTILGATGAFGWEELLGLVLSHPRHPRFIVEKLWGAFHHEPLDRATRKRLIRVYRRRNGRLLPVVRELLEHAALYSELRSPPLVKSPVVYVAGMLRATGRGIESSRWVALLASMGQLPFHPPSVAGWDGGEAWLNTNSMRARFTAANELLRDAAVVAVEGDEGAQLAAARAATGASGVSPATSRTLRELATTLAGADGVQRQRALRHLLLSGPDAQVH